MSMRKFTSIKTNIKKTDRLNEDFITKNDLKSIPTSMSTNIKKADIDSKELTMRNEGTNVIKLFSKLFESREMAHIYHLQSRTLNNGDAYSQHIILGDYYENIIGQIDELIEVYQGQYGLVDGYELIDTSRTKKLDCLEYFEDLAECIKHCRKSISSEDTHLHSIIDVIVSIIYRTVYKLKFLSKKY